MCIFSSDVESVEGTSIFARRTSPTSQALVYSMSYEARSELAMILPLPKSLGAGEDAATFIDLSSYSNFFTDMQFGFPVESRPGASSSPQDGRGAALSPLKVHEVGSFEASWVPTLSDFSRLDDRFTLPSASWDQLPQYSDYGFAVFKLKPGAKTAHPMALEFQTRESDRLFFPTVHVHNGAVLPDASFDHVLYCQSDSARLGGDWKASTFIKGSPFFAKNFIQIDRAKGLVLPDQVVFKNSVYGRHPNQDIWAG